MNTVENNVKQPEPKTTEKAPEFTHFEMTMESAQVLMKALGGLPFDTIEPLIVYLRQNLIGIVKEKEQKS